MLTIFMYIPIIYGKKVETLFADILAYKSDCFLHFI